MEKISNQQIAEVLTDAATELRAKQATIVELTDKLASREKRDRVEKLAAAMHGKGLELDTSVSALADRYEKTASDKLDAIEHAVDLVGPDMGLKLAQVNNDEPGASSGVSSDFERYIAGSVG